MYLLRDAFSMKSIAYGDLCVNRSPVPAVQSAGHVVVSAALQAANEQLLARRARQHPAAQSHRFAPAAEGWGGALFDTVRCHAAGDAIAAESMRATRSDAVAASATHSASITIHPTVLLAMLKQEQAAIGRIWLLARLLDKSGSGCITVETLRKAVTQKESAYYVCGWRRLRQIIGHGKTHFWTRDKAGRLYLRSAAHVAANLGVTQLSGDAVALPADRLLGSIGKLRAAFYTTFHSGRNAAPISRATLSDITGVPERTQRNYDRAQQTERIENVTLLSHRGDAETQWQYGRAAFDFVDRQGHHGMVGQQYTAVRLPNSYEPTRYTRIERKRKRLNKQLKQVLAQRGMQGNSDGSLRQLFFADGHQVLGALKQTNRRSDTQADGCFLHSKRVNKRSFWISCVC